MILGVNPLILEMEIDMKTLDELIKLEYAFEVSDMELYEGKFVKAKELLGEFLNGNWDKVYQLSEEIIESSQDVDLQAFALDWAIRACGYESNMEKRSKLFDSWSKIKEEKENGFHTYLKSHQMAFKSFYDAHLHQAKVGFEYSLKLAKKLKNERRILFALFQLGLTARDLGDKEQAKFYFSLCNEICASGKYERTRKRVAKQFMLLDEEGEEKLEKIDKLTIHLEQFILRKDVEGARNLLTQCEMERRRLKQGRKKVTFRHLLGLLYRLQGKNSLAKIIESKISDPIVKLRYLNLKFLVVGLTLEEEWEIEHYKSINGISDLVHFSNGDVKLCGVHLSRIKDSSLQEFSKLLVEERKFSKEKIVQKLWNLKYDPTIHDNRIYKLIYKVRKHYRKPDLILNNYGSYQLNPKYTA